MSTIVSTQVQLVSRPHGWPAPEDFRTVQVTYGDLQPGQVRVVNAFVSVDPYMRGRMNDVKSYAPPYALGATMTGGAIGRVVDSASDAVPVGAVVLHQYGWRDVVQEDAAGFQVVPDVPGVPLSARLGILGMTGLTAYVGLTTIAGLTAGDTVFVSGAAGAVGQTVGQLAKIKGCRVVGIAGGPAKCEWVVKELGFDACIDYKAPGPNGTDSKDTVKAGLKEHCPKGVDIYFDNVGGDILDTVLARINRKARIVICGAISQYNNTTPVQGPANYLSLLVNRARMEGMVVFDYIDRYPVAIAEMAGYLKAGKMKSKEDVVTGGVRAFPETLLKLFNGENFGKLVLQFA